MEREKAGQALGAAPDNYVVPGFSREALGASHTRGFGALRPLALSLIITLALKSL